MMRLILLPLLLCGLVACSSTNGIVLDGGDGRDTSLQIDNAGMGQRLGLSLGRQQRVDGRLQVAVQLKSHIAYDQTLQYRIDWFDEAGMPVEPDSTSWLPLVLHGGEQRVIRVSALLPQATAFHFSVRDVVKD
jgi:uncharacterized protein YcfL